MGPTYRAIYLHPGSNLTQRDRTNGQQEPVLGRGEKAAGKAREETTPRNGRSDQSHLWSSQEDLKGDSDLGYVRPVL